MRALYTALIILGALTIFTCSCHRDCGYDEYINDTGHRFLSDHHNCCSRHGYNDAIAPREFFDPVDFDHDDLYGNYRDWRSIDYGRLPDSKCRHHLDHGNYGYHDFYRHEKYHWYGNHNHQWHYPHSWNRWHRHYYDEDAVSERYAPPVAPDEDSEE